jgi:hypothetical protein
MAKTDIITTYSRIVIHWATSKLTLAPMELVSHGQQLTYAAKDGVMTFTWSEFDKDKASFVVKGMPVPLYNIAYAECFTESTQGESNDTTD